MNSIEYPEKDCRSILFRLSSCLSFIIKPSNSEAGQVICLNQTRILITLSNEKISARSNRFLITRKLGLSHWNELPKFTFNDAELQQLKGGLSDLKLYWGFRTIKLLSPL